MDASATASHTTAVSATRTSYDAIRQMIISGDLAPGEKLKIETLKDRLRTGASPIREALTLLVSDQLVERIDQRGFRAAPVSHENFAEILKLRCTLEPVALRDSLAQADAAWEEAVVRAHHRLTRAGTRNAPTYDQRHKSFHLSLLANCGSPILLRYCSQLYDLNVRYRHLAGQSPSYRARQVAEEHRAILDAALARDADLASRRLLHHYRNTGSLLWNDPEAIPD